jgi:hypothetical protein
MSALSRKLAFRWPLVGVLTAAASVVGARAPAGATAPSSVALEPGAVHSGNALSTAADGTYEACSAYFGLGKDAGVLDVAAFDVADQNGADGIHHAVPTDTQVVLVLKNSQGDTLECTPPEITKSEWDDAMSGIDSTLPVSTTLPAWPGPGHYAYPSLASDPSIDGFGTVTDVGFEVTTIPAGHTLVSPTGVEKLTQHYVIPFNDGPTLQVDPRVLAFVQTHVDQAARDALAAAFTGCDDDAQVDFSEEHLKAAMDAFVTYLTGSPGQGYTCSDLALMNPEMSLLLGLQQSIAYTEHIVLKLPEPTTTTSTSTTVGGTAPVADAATPIPASPNFTG